MGAVLDAAEGVLGLDAAAVVDVWGMPAAAIAAEAGVSAMASAPVRCCAVGRTVGSAAEG
jgi:hypothetical protein